MEQGHQVGVMHGLIKPHYRLPSVTRSVTTWGFSTHCDRVAYLKCSRAEGWRICYAVNNEGLRVNAEIKPTMTCNVRV